MKNVGAQRFIEFNQTSTDDGVKSQFVKLKAFAINNWRI